MDDAENNKIVIRIMPIIVKIRNICTKKFCAWKYRLED